MSNYIFGPPYMVAASDWVRDAIAPSDHVRPTTTDAELEQLAVDWLQQAGEEYALLEGDLLYELHQFREWIRAKDDTRQK